MNLRRYIEQHNKLKLNTFLKFWGVLVDTFIELHEIKRNSGSPTILQMQEQQIISIRLSFLYSLGTEEKGNRDICFVKIRSHQYLLLNIVFYPIQ